MKLRRSCVCGKIQSLFLCPSGHAIFLSPHFSVSVPPGSFCGRGFCSAWDELDPFLADASVYDDCSQSRFWRGDRRFEGFGGGQLDPAFPHRVGGGRVQDVFVQPHIAHAAAQARLGQDQIHAPG